MIRKERVPEHQQQVDWREGEGDERHQAQELGVNPLAFPLGADQELHEERVFDAHAKSFAGLAIFRERARQRILKTLRGAGEKHEVQQHIKMEDDKKERSEPIKAHKRQGIVKHRQFERLI